MASSGTFQIRSLAFIAGLACGCVDDPQIVLHVVRATPDDDLLLRTCNAPPTTRCVPGTADASVFGTSNALEQTVSIYVDDGSPSVVLKLDDLRDPGFELCVTVDVTHGIVRRDVHTPSASPWMCLDPGTVCEVPIDCDFGQPGVQPVQP